MIKLSNQDELILYLCENVKMGLSSTTKIIKILKNKDNKIKKVLESYVKTYEHYLKMAKDLKQKYNVKATKNKFMQKLMANTMMEEEIKRDNSDSKIANILIRGFTMGEIDIEKRIKDFVNNLDKKEKSDILELAKELHAFNKNSIVELKDYL